MKVQVVTHYLALGKAPLVEALTGIPRQTIRLWKTQPWWGELVRQIQQEENQEVDSKLSKIINKSLDVVNDRLENGEMIYNSRTKELIRVPVKLRDVGTITRDMFQQRDKIRREPELREREEAQADRLLKLAETFAEFAKNVNGKKAPQTVEAEILEESTNEVLEEITDAVHDQWPEELQKRVPGVPREAGADQESLPEEPGEGSLRGGARGSDGEGYRPQETNLQGREQLQIEFTGSQPVG